MSVRKGKYSLVYASKHAISFKKDRPLQFMLAVYLVVFTVLSLKPIDNFEWWYESTASFAFLVILTVLYRKSRLTNLSYACILAFLILHTIGAHYTYALCPVGEWMKGIFDFGRNNYDRLVGLAFGLLVSLPVMEFLYHRLRLRYIEACILSVIIIMAFCAFDSVVDMFSTVILSPGQAEVFLGTQGDIWDSQKDIAISLAGAIASMGSCIYLKLRKNNKIHMVKASQ